MSEQPRFRRIRLFFQYVGILTCLGLALGTLWLGQDRIVNQTREEQQKETTNRLFGMPEAMHRGTWDWRAPDEISEQSAQADLTFLAEHGINTVYLDITRYVDYYEMPEGSEKQAKISGFQESLKSYVTEAGKRNLAVHAAAGDTSWGLSDHAYIQKILVTFVHSYNQGVTDDERLKGLQFDVEVHNHESFKKNKKTVLQQYLNSVRDAVQHYQSLQADYLLGYTLPYWFDNENGNIPEITHGQKTAPAAYHVFDILQTIEHGYAVIMDYRNTVEGEDGSVAHAQNEVVYTSKNAQKVKLVIAQETTNVEPAKITFYHKTTQDLMTALQRLHATFRPYGSYHGLAVHDIKGYRALVEKLPK